MEGFAYRRKEWNGSVIRHDTVEHFVEDLITTGYLIEQAPPDGQ
jgi:hypothetical protein